MLENSINNLDMNSFFKNLIIKKSHIKNLNSKTVLLKNQKLLSKINFFNISSVVYILQSKTDIFLKVMDSSGSLQYFLSAYSVGFKGKSKRKATRQILKKFVEILLNSNKLYFLRNKPIGLHFKNVGVSKFWVTRKLKKIYYIETIRVFNVKPFNGCRAKKLRRKK